MQTETPTLTVTRAGQRKGVGVAGCQTTNTFLTICFTLSCILSSSIYYSYFSSFPSCFYTKKEEEEDAWEKNYKKNYASLKISSSWYPMKNLNSQYSRPTLIVQIFRVVLSLHCSSERATWSNCKTPNTNCRELFPNWVLRHLGSTGSALAYVQSHGVSVSVRRTSRLPAKLFDSLPNK